MKKMLFILFALYHVSASYSHEYHFSFAEMEYNSSNRQFELTISASAHDLEHWLHNSGLRIKHLEYYRDDLFMSDMIAQRILEGFQVNTKDRELYFQLVGYEVLNTGITNFYFTSTELDKPLEIEVKFDLMMSDNNEQQNKLTLIDQDTQQTFNFFADQRTQNIKLETSE